MYNNRFRFICLLGQLICDPRIKEKILPIKLTISSRAHDGEVRPEAGLEDSTEVAGNAFVRREP